MKENPEPDPRDPPPARPAAQPEAVRRLRPALRAPEGDPAGCWRGSSTPTTNFDDHYRIFYDELAPLLRLYQISVGDTITIKAPSRAAPSTP